MYVQWFVKGIVGSGGSPPSTVDESASLSPARAKGIQSNWWRVKGTIGTDEIAQILTDQNLDRHLHDYANFGANSPFISLAVGCVERDILPRAATSNCSTCGRVKMLHCSCTECEFMREEYLQQAVRRLPSAASFCPRISTDVRGA